MPFYDFKKVEEIAKTQIESLVYSWLPGGKLSGQEYSVLNPTRNDSSEGSFKINLSSGNWSDFATGDAGKSIVSLHAYLFHGGDYTSSAQELAVRFGISADKNKSKGKGDITKPYTKHWLYGEPTKVWKYDDEFLVYRFDPPDIKKQFWPLCWNSDINEWEWKTACYLKKHGSLPLYNKSNIIKHDGIVVFGEGEKAADAIPQYFPDCVATTTTKQIKKTDFTPVKGKEILIWRDNDLAGKKYVELIIPMLAKVKPKSIKILVLPDGLPNKWDAADPLPMGFDVSKFEQKIVDLSVLSVLSVKEEKQQILNAPVASQDGINLLKRNRFGDLVFIGDLNIADQLYEKLLLKLRFCNMHNIWFIYKENYWQSASKNEASGLIADTIKKYSHGCNVSAKMINDVTKMLMMSGRLLQNNWNNSQNIPFKNGVLDAETRKLRPHNPNDLFIYQLGYNYEVDRVSEDKNPIIQWLKDTTENNDDVQLIRALFKIIILGKNNRYQKYLELLGPSGTGKGTLLNLIQKLVPEEVTHNTNLKRMDEHGRFEFIHFHNKRLVVVGEGDKHITNVTSLLTITGGDKIPGELKHGNVLQKFHFEGVLLVAANRPITSNDSAGALERRRLIVWFRKNIKKSQVRDLIEEFKPYFSNFIDWCLDIKDIDRIIRMHGEKQLNVDSTQAKMDYLLDIEPIARWMHDNIIIDPNGKTLVGIGKSNGHADYQNSDKELYANYCEWAEGNGHKNKKGKSSFTADVKTLLWDKFQFSNIVYHKISSAGMGFSGISIRGDYDDEKISPIQSYYFPNDNSDLECRQFQYRLKSYFIKNIGCENEWIKINQDMESGKSTQEQLDKYNLAFENVM